MSAPPGSARTPSTTAPAGSRENQSRVFVGPRIVAREFARLFAAHGIAAHPGEVRRLAVRFCAGGRGLDEVEAFVLSYVDPTGETAVRNLMRGGGDG